MCIGQLLGGPAGDGGIQVASATCWTNLSGHPCRPAFFYKIHSGTVSLDKDKYLTPPPNLHRTMASHDLQHTRYFAYVMPLRIPSFPELFHCGIVFRLRWPPPRPLRSLKDSFRLLVQRYVF